MTQKNLFSPMQTYAGTNVFPNFSQTEKSQK